MKLKQIILQNGRKLIHFAKAYIVLCYLTFLVSVTSLTSFTFRGFNMMANIYGQQPAATAYVTQNGLLIPAGAAAHASQQHIFDYGSNAAYAAQLANAGYAADTQTAAAGTCIHTFVFN